MVTHMGYTQNYNLSFSGRTQNSNYYVALGRSNQRGMVVGNDFARNNVSMNLSTHVTSNIEIGATINTPTPRTTTSPRARRSSSPRTWSLT